MPGTEEWEFAYRVLLHGRPKLRPWEVDRMTMPEIALALDQNIEDKRPPSSGTPIDHANREEYARWWRSQTPTQRLERARKRWGY